MKTARYAVLLQRRFDVPLTERETFELQGYLDGNESAAKLFDSLSRLIQEAEEIDLSAHYAHVDPQELFESIVASLSGEKPRFTWASIIEKLLSPKKRSNTAFPQDSLQQPTKNTPSEDVKLLQTKNRSVATSRANTYDTARAKVLGDASPDRGSGSLSLAEAIKARVAQQVLAHGLSSDQVDSDARIAATGVSQYEEQDSEMALSAHQHSQSQQQSQSQSQQQSQLQSQSMAVASGWAFPPEQNYETTQEQQQRNSDWDQEVPSHEWHQTSDAVYGDWQHAANSGRSSDNAQETNLSGPSSDVVSKEALVAPAPITPQVPIEPVADVAPRASLAPPVSEPQANPFARLAPSANLIPVNDIIDHVNSFFGDHVDDAALQARIRKTESARESEVPNRDQFITSGWPVLEPTDASKVALTRLGTTPDTVATSGNITSLGKFLLDKKSENAIGLLAGATVNLPTARTVSSDEATALTECMRPINEQDGVAGCLILGYDGMIISTTLPAGTDGDAFSAWALLTYMYSQDVVKLLGHQQMKQLVSRTQSGYLLLADFGQGLLLAVSDNAATDALVPLMKSVRRVTAA